MSIRNAVSFSSKKWDDGYDIFCSSNVTLNDEFIRTNDDDIAFYGGGKSGFTGDCKNMTVTNSTFIPDLAHSFHIGVYGDQNIDTQIRDITVANADICDQSRTTDQGCIYFTVGDRVRAANFKFNNVRDQDFKAAAFITMAVVYNGTYNYNAGCAIDSVFYTNVSYTGSGTPYSSINGNDATRKATNVFITIYYQITSVFYEYGMLKRKRPLPNQLSTALTNVGCLKNIESLELFSIFVAR